MNGFSADSLLSTIYTDCSFGMKTSLNLDLEYSDTNNSPQAALDNFVVVISDLIELLEK